MPFRRAKKSSRLRKTLLVLLLASVLAGALYVYLRYPPPRAFNPGTDLIVHPSGHIRFNGTATNVNISVSLSYNYSGPLIAHDLKVYLTNETYLGGATLFSGAMLVDERLGDTDVRNISSYSVSAALVNTGPNVLRVCKAWFLLHFDFSSGPAPTLDWAISITDASCGANPQTTT